MLACQRAGPQQQWLADVDTAPRILLQTIMDRRLPGENTDAPILFRWNRIEGNTQEPNRKVETKVDIDSVTGTRAK